MSKQEFESLEQSLEAALESGDESALDAALLQGEAPAPSVADPSSDDSEPADKAAQADSDKLDTDQPSTDDVTAAKAEQEPQPVKTTDTPAAGEGGETPAPIQNKSGTGTIPYGTLKAARQRGAQLEEQLNAAQGENKALRERLEALAAKASDDGTPDESDAADALTEAMASGGALSQEDFDDLPEALQTLYRDHMALKQQMQELKQGAERLQQTAAKTEAEKTQEVIDMVPDLAQWQASGSQLFAVAQKYDAELMADPAYDDKSDLERFRAVVDRIREEAGMPARDWDEVQKTSPEPGKRQPAADPVPSSISHLPGGGLPPLDTADTVERSSASALEAQLNGKSDEAIDDWLTRAVG